MYLLYVHTCACQRRKRAEVESVLVGAWFMSVNIYSGFFKIFFMCICVLLLHLLLTFLWLLDKVEEINHVNVFPAAT